MVPTSGKSDAVSTKDEFHTPWSPMPGWRPKHAKLVYRVKHFRSQNETESIRVQLLGELNAGVIFSMFMQRGELVIQEGGGGG